MGKIGIKKAPTTVNPYFLDNSRFIIPNKRAVTIFGRNPDVDDSLETVWNPGGLYVYPPDGGIQMAISSSSGSDTSVGIGARLVELHYLDSNYDEHDAEITLNGTTPVNTTATDILRVLKCHAIAVGSNLVPVGIISVKNLAGTVTYSQIPAGINQSFDCIYTVPRGYTAYILSWKVGIGNNQGNRYGEFYLRATCHDDEGVIEYNKDVFHVYDVISVQDGGLSHTFSLPIKVPAKSDIMVSAFSDAANANAICTAMVEFFTEAE